MILYILKKLLFLMLLLAMVALACFNIWRKLRKKTRNQY